MRLSSISQGNLVVKKFVVVLFLSGIVACGDQAPNMPQHIKKNDYSVLQEYLPKLASYNMEKNNISGLSIALVNDQEVIYSQGFGWAKKSKQEKVNPNTVFCIASVSKLFTGMAIMQLVEQGKVDLDQPISTYLSDFNVKSRFSGSSQITVRHLLTHHSGLPSDRIKGYFFRDFYGDKPVVIKPEESFYALAAQLKDDYVATKPNTIFSYSNIGYALLGDIVSRVSGIPFEEYVKQNLFDTMHMRSSSFKLSDINIDRLSLGYLSDKEVGVPVIRDIPAGQMMSSANDLSQFLKMIFRDGKFENNAILSESSIREMFHIQNSEVENDGYFRIGLTFWGLPKDSQFPDARWHGGDLPPYYSTLVVLPHSKLGVVVLSNSGQEGSLDLMEIALPVLKLAHEIKTGKTREPVRVTKATDVKSEDLKKYEKLYAMTLGVVDVKASDTELELKLLGKTLHATPLSDGSFTPYYKLAGLLPMHPDELKKLKIAFDETGNTPRLKLQRSGVTAMGSLVAIKPEPILDAWLSRVGDYELLNPDVEEGYTPKGFIYDEQQGFLFFALEMTSKRYNGKIIQFPLKTLTNDQAIIMGQGRSMGESILVFRENGEEIIYYSGYKLKKKTGS